MPHSTIYWEAAWANLSAAQASMATIALRLPGLMSVGLTQDPGHLREAHMMVAEKTTAAIEGSMAAALSVQKLWLDAMFGKLTLSASLASPATIAMAASGPAHQAVAANAERLRKQALGRLR